MGVGGGIRVGRVPTGAGGRWGWGHGAVAYSRGLVWLVGRVGEGRMRIVGLRLWTSELGALRGFYTGVLGLPLVEEGPGEGLGAGAAWFTVRAGATLLTFVGGATASTAGRACGAGVGVTRLTFVGGATGAPTYHVAFNIPRNLLSAAKVWLVGRAALLTLDGADEFDSPSWNARQVYFLDPAGNILEFIARQNLRDDGVGPFDAGAILNVSEIGLPTDDVTATVARLVGEHGFAPFRERSETFAPVGDEEGLLIVVRRGRPWFPTTRAAEGHRVEVTIGGES